jgi:hypothetical protein
MIGSLYGRWKLRRLITAWKGFHDLLLRWGASKEVPAETEQAFLDVKARVASLLPVLSTRVPVALAAEAGQHVELMTGLLNRYRRLAEVPDDEREREGFELRWHQAFIFLSKLTGVSLAPASAPHRGARPASVPTGIPTGLPTGRTRVRRPLPGLWVIPFAVKLGLFALVVYLLGRAFGVRWDGGFHLAGGRPQSASAVGQGAVGGVQDLWHITARFLEPVTSTYGTNLTIGLVGVLLLGIGYLVFIRGR